MSRPLVWIEAPVADVPANIIAALGFGELAEVTVAHTLRTARLGNTGEAHALEKRRRMLPPESRLLGEFKTRGAVSNDSVRKAP